ncbi:hypothetical protein Sste5346_009707 [Sporothrix stenoceras]|uniref:Uncharacterized protein n=1 Tax=Sporothrix stenoceras TaxID=5173 RepID=A0ABR3YIT8_9PEZI
MVAVRLRKAARLLTLLAITFASLSNTANAAVRIPSNDEQLPIGDTIPHVDISSPQRYTPPLNFSSSAPHLFASAYGLLQQWANTVFPNGHAMVAATIPAYTLMYHGLRAEEANPDPDTLSPPSPEWLAFDLEMAYGIMGSARRSWLLTYQTTRPVRVLYVDGESAALMGLGQLDSQMLLLYGNVTGPSHDDRKGFGGLTDEYDRARGMCDWLERQGLRGRGWGYEGIVRMNAGFELIWCDFMSDSLRLLSRLNVTAPLDPVVVEEEEEEEVTDDEAKAAEQSYYTLPPVPTRSDRAIEPTNPPAPPNWRGGGGGRYGPGFPGDDDSAEKGEEPFLTSQGWGWFESATWHYGASRSGPGAGETRVQVDNCGILSYYAPRFEGGTLAQSRAEDEQKRLNLTAEGFWSSPCSSDANRTIALRQLGRRRRFHHLGNASVEDALLMRRSSEEALARTLSIHPQGGDVSSSACSGASWTLILSEIVQRMARHLKTVEAILLDGPSDTNQKNTTETRSWLHRLRSQNHMFMVGYLEYPTNKADTSAWQPGTVLFNRTLSLCRYRYTRLFAAGDERGQLPPEEDDLRWAIEETYGTLCAELLGIGFDVERAWAEKYLAKQEERDEDSLAMSTGYWLDQLTELIAWLGWENEWIGCDRVCGWNERCFIPMWPLMSSQWGRGGGPGGHPGGGEGGGPGGRPGGPGHRPPNNGSHGGGGRRSPPGFGFPRSPAMMGDDTDLWEPKCVEAWYIMGGR